MARSVLYAVFLLPVIFSIIFGATVMADVLQKSDRELNMWPTTNNRINDKSIEIIGLAKQYSVSSPVKVMVNVNDKFYDCGDLYITIYNSNKEVVTQSGFLEQCFNLSNKSMPIEDDFSQVIDSPGQYEIVAEIKDKTQKDSILTSEKFTVK